MLLSYHFILSANHSLKFFFLIIDLYFLIPTILAQIFNFTEELLIPIEMPTNEAKAEIETHPVISETKISDFSV